MYTKKGTDILVPTYGERFIQMLSLFVIYANIYEQKKNIREFPYRTFRLA